AVNQFTVSFQSLRKRFPASGELVSYMRVLPQPLVLQSGSRFETSESNGQDTIEFSPKLARQFFRKWETVPKDSRNKIVERVCSVAARSREISRRRPVLSLLPSL